ncbi:Co-chaperone [Basidiobolus ranarum]|uniref:Co-chaperone n=1 Tax=Basidiobolus ranarum TaxID=34480 RepID=A0ABR2X2Y1_9FUNG
MSTQANWKNVNNWHWTEKNCAPWAKEYFSRELRDIEASDKGISVKTTSVTEVIGDVDLNQRKGKIFTLFDLQITLNWTGSDNSGTQASGKIHIPEVAHDSDFDDYVFNITVHEDTSDKYDIKQVVHKKLTQELRKKLSKFSKDLAEAHVKDVYIDPSELQTQPTSNNSSTPATAAPPISTSKTSTITKQASSAAINTVKNTNDYSDRIVFPINQKALYGLLMNQKRVHSWSRTATKIDGQVGGRFELFNGEISGKFLEIIPEEKIVMEWRLSSWAEGVLTNVTLTLEEVEEGTALNLQQKDIPRGQLNVATHKWKLHYWQPLQVLMERKKKKQARAEQRAKAEKSFYIYSAAGLLVAGAGYLIFKFV